MRLTHYELLGVKNDANIFDIEEAYARLSAIWHPDNAKVWTEENTKVHIVYERMKLAYEVLTNTIARREYNEILTTPAPVSAIKLDEDFRNIYWEPLQKSYGQYTQRLQNPTIFLAHLQEKAEIAKKHTDYVGHQLTGLYSVVAKMQQQNQVLSAELAAVQHENVKLKQTIQTQHNIAIMLVQMLKQNPQPNLSSLTSNSQFFSAKAMDISTPKIKPDNLKMIYKIVDENLQFYEFRLIFANAESTKKFLDQARSLYDHYQNEGNGPQFVINYDYRLNSSSAVDCILQIAVHANSELCVAIKNSPATKEQLILHEVEKYVDITDIPQEFRDGRNREISLENLMTEYKRAMNP